MTAVGVYAVPGQNFPPMDEIAQIIDQVYIHRRNEFNATLLIPIGSLLEEANTVLSGLKQSARENPDTLKEALREFKSLKKAVQDIASKRSEKILLGRFKGTSTMTLGERTLHELVTGAVKTCYPELS